MTDTIILNKNEKNWQKLNDLLEEVQKRSEVRTLKADDIKKIIKQIETNLQTKGLPKSKWDGIVVYCNPYQDRYPSAYQYTPQGTVFDLIYKSGAWRVECIKRDICDGSIYKKIEYRFTDDQKQAILNAMQYDSLDRW